MSESTTMDDLSGVKHLSKTGGARRWSLVIMASSLDGAVGRLLELGRTPHVLERVASDEDSDGLMSRRHATAWVEGGAVTVRDGAADGNAWKRSNNNTFVGNTALDDSDARLQAGDLVRTGKTLWMAVVNAAPAPSGSLLAGVSGALDDARVEIGLAVARTASRLKGRRRVSQALLVTGPRGSGKQVVAREAHRMLVAKLGHKNVPFRQVSAPSMGDGTAAADLFGVVDRYATDVKGRTGYFEQADGGVLLLDEIGNAPLTEQAKLLHVLQERTVTPLGGATARPFDCLVIAATNRDLNTDEFRADLRDRLGRFHVHLPPLDSRPEDIAVIAAQLAQGHGLEHPLPWDAVQALLNRQWPGNVRQLDVVMERLAALCGLHEVPPDAEMVERAAAVIERGQTSTEAAPKGSVSQRKRPSEAALVAALKAHDGNKTATARSFGKDRRQVLRWMSHYGLGDEDIDT